MTAPSLLDRLAELHTNTVSDALDFLELPGATYGLRPLWDCPKIVGRASTIRLGPKQGTAPTVHLISPVIARVTTDDRVLVIAGGVEGISCWGDILANAAKVKSIRGSVIDGLSRDIEGSESAAYPVYGLGVTVREDDHVIADRCGTVIVPAAEAERVLLAGEARATKEAAMMEQLTRGATTLELMGLGEWRTKA